MPTAPIGLNEQLITHAAQKGLVRGKNALRWRADVADNLTSRDEGGT